MRNERLSRHARDAKQSSRELANNRIRISIRAGRGVYQCLVALLALSQGSADFNFGDPLTNIGALLYISCAAVLLAMGAYSGATQCR